MNLGLVIGWTRITNGEKSREKWFHEIKKGKIEKLIGQDGLFNHRNCENDFNNGY